MIKNNGDDLAFRLVPEGAVLRRDTDRLTIKAPHAAVDLSGSSADLFEQKILPLLDGTHSVSEIAVAAGLSGTDMLAGLLSELNKVGLLYSDAPGSGADPFLDYLETVGLDRAESRSLLSAFRVAVFGNGRLAREIVRALGELHVGVAEIIDGSEDSPVGLEEDALLQHLASYDFVVSAFGAAHPAIDHRVNRVIHELGVPALFCRVGTASSLLGPLVFPFETACFTCARMRVAACASDFTAHLAYEEAVAARPDPVYDAGGSVGYLTQILAGEAVNQIIKTKLAFGRANAVDHLLEYVPFQTGWTFHKVLRRPDCPVCSKKNFQPPEHPLLQDLSCGKPGDLAAHIDELVSPLTGIVRKLHRIHKDLSEPQRPYVWRAELANHRFLETDDSPVVASGKGFTHAAARLSAMGEAIERYAASSWGEERIQRGRADRLDMPSLDPARLVLFQPEQYPGLKYDPYEPDCSLGWVAMRSLVDGRERAVPALAVLMAYETQGDEPFLFPITSNGLAAGPTLADAILSGAYEVIERDAFLSTWLNRLPCRAVDPSDHPDPDIRDLVTAHARRDISLELFQAPTDNGVHVFIGIAFAPAPGTGLWSDGPAAVVGLGAGHDPARAAAGALVEACQVRPALRMRLRQPEVRSRMEDLVRDPSGVTELEDHDLLYASTETLAQFDFLRKAPPGRIDWSLSQTGPRTTIDCLEDLSAKLAAQGTDLLYANLTSDDARTVGASVARVVIPDYQPMHFGFRERRLAASRLYRFPEHLGLAPTTPHTLNPYPHPLA